MAFWLDLSLGSLVYLSWAASHDLEHLLESRFAFCVVLPI